MFRRKLRIGNHKITISCYMYSLARVDMLRYGNNNNNIMGLERT